MNKLKYITPICFVLFLFIVSSSTVFAYSFGPPDGRTGAPNENTCTECHSGNSLNAAGGSLVLTVPKTYEPGEVYDIVVKLSRNGQRRWGFQMTALNGNVYTCYYSYVQAVQIVLSANYSVYTNYKLMNMKVSRSNFQDLLQVYHQVNMSCICSVRLSNNVNLDCLIADR